MIDFIRPFQHFCHRHVKCNFLDISIRTIKKSLSGEKTRRKVEKEEGISMISSCGDHFYEGDQSSNEETGEFMCSAHSRRTDKIPRELGAEIIVMEIARENREDEDVEAAFAVQL